MAVSVRSRTGRVGTSTERVGRVSVAAPGEGAGARRDRLEDRIEARLRGTIGDDQYERHFGGRAAWVVSDGTLEVRVASRFLAGFLDRRFGEALSRVAEAEAPGTEVRVRVSGAQAGARTTGPASGQEATDAGADVSVLEQRPRGSGTDEAPVARPGASRSGGAGSGTRPSGRTALGDAEPDDERYALERFVIGPANELAFHAAVELAEAPADRAGRPIATGARMSSLFVHGPCGMGKTHLLRGAARRFRELHPGARVKCTTGEAFTRSFVASVRKGEMDRFRRSLRGVDLLCIDDVHFLSNKEATQEELLHTFDAIDLSGARVMLASDEHPREIRRFSRALVSRFLSGMVTRLDPPDLALRERLVAELGRRRGLGLEPAAVRAIAVRLDCGAGAGGAAGADRPTSIREIEGTLTRLEAVSRLLPEFQTSGSIGLLAVERALGFERGGRDDARGARPVDLASLIDAACGVLSIEVSELLGRGRHPRVVLARSIVSLLARRSTTLSFPEIARGLGRASHSTVVAACRRLEARLASGCSEFVAVGREGLTLGEVLERVSARASGRMR